MIQVCVLRLKSEFFQRHLAVLVLRGFEFKSLNYYEVRKICTLKMGTVCGQWQSLGMKFQYSDDGCMI